MMKALTEKVTFGFWVYLMSDCVLFAGLFATYAVLHTATFGGPSAADISLDLRYIFIETLILLTSSFTIGLSVLFAGKSTKEGKTWPSGPERALSEIFRHNKTFLILLLATLVLGFAFLGWSSQSLITLLQRGVALAAAHFSPHSLLWLVRTGSMSFLARSGCWC
jgi:heme/copper-type cytochrome/quinol oxidase subunit 3